MYNFVVWGIEVLKFYLIFRYGFEIPKRKIYELRKGLDISTILSLAVWISVGTITFIKPEMGDSFLFYICWIQIEVILLCHYEIKKLILLTGCSMFLIGDSDSLLHIGFQIISNVMDLSLGRITNIWASGITLILLGITIFYIPSKNNGRLKQVGIKYFVLVLFVSLLNTLVVAYLWSFIEADKFGKNSIKLTVISLLILISVYFQIGLILKLAISNNLYKVKHQMNLYYLDLQERHYLYLEQKERETKKFRHDIKSHMYTISNLCENRKFEELTSYVESLWGKIDNISGGIYVNNGIVEAILNQYNAMCKEKNIQLRVSGHLSTQYDIELFDLCTVFSNLIQNAYEAAEKCINGEINIKIRHDDAGIYIQGKNNCIVDERVLEDRLKTSKNDYNNHGFGTLNMRESIKNYNGTFAYEFQEKSEEESWFMVNIAMFYRK